MKFCIITSSYPARENDSRNAGVFVENFAHHLQELGHEVLVITPGKKNATSKNRRVPVKFFKTLGEESELVNLDPKKTLDLIKLVFLLTSGKISTLLTLRRYRPDHVLACWAVPSGIFSLIANKILGVPYSIWALGSDIWKINQYPLGVYLLKKILKNADRLFADGVKLTDIVHGYAGRHCEFLPSSRDLPTTAQAESRGGKTRFVMISRWHPDKGPDVLLNAARVLREKTQNFVVDIYGGGPMEKYLREDIEKYDLREFVRLHGYLDPTGVAAQIQGSDCVVIPSRVESIPLVFSEATRFKKHLIVAQTGDMEVLSEKYGIGYSFLIGDFEELALAMEKVVNGEHKSLPNDFNAVNKIFEPRNAAEKFVREVSVSDPRDAFRSSHVIWDRQHRAGSPVYALRKKLLIKAINDYARAGGTALDAGCGTGEYIEEFFNKKMSAFGFDPSDYAVEEVRKSFREKVQVDKATISSYQAREKFDLILASEVLQYVDEERADFEKLVSWLKPGGILIVSVPYDPDLGKFDASNPHVNNKRYSRADFRKLASGLSLVQKKEWVYGFPILRLYSYLTNSIKSGDKLSDQKVTATKRFAMMLVRGISQLDRLFLHTSSGVGLIEIYQKKSE